MAGADRQHPVTAHLDPFVQRLQRFVVEGVFAAFFLACPDHCFMGVGKAFAAEIRHRVGFAPDNIVQQPEPRILHRGSDAENVVIRRDDPDRAMRFKQAARGLEPCAGEFVIDSE